MFFQSKQLKLESNSGSVLGRDKRAKVVQVKIVHIHDLHAADAVYHHNACSVNFRTVKQILAFHEHENNSLKRVHRDSFSQVHFCSQQESNLSSFVQWETWGQTNLLQYKHLFEKVATTTFLFLHKHPPTFAVAKYHCLRVYFQILEWKGCADEVSPIDIGNGRKVVEKCLYLQICHWLQMSCKQSHVVAEQTTTLTTV